MNVFVVDNRTSDSSLLFAALSIAWRLGYTIVVPLIVFALGGRLLDRHFGTSPILFLAGIVIAVVMTSVWLVVVMQRFVGDLKREARPPDDESAKKTNV